MSRLHDAVRRGVGYGAAATLILLGAVTSENRAARANDAGAPPAASGTTGATAAKPKSIKQNVKELGQEITDPGTAARIKAHEQELEKKIERTREQQRKDHGTAKPHDAVDLAKSLDNTDKVNGKPSGEGKAKREGKAKPDETPRKLDAKAKTDGKSSTIPPEASKPAPTP